MSDPFSIASGAVGVISLGLQLTGQVVSYCQGYRDYDDDTRRVDNKAKSLEFSLNRTLSILKDALSTDPQIASDLQARILELRTSFQTLRTKFEKYQPVSTTASVDVRSQLKRMAHPFRKDTLRDIGNDLDSIEQTIQTSLNLYTAQMTANSQRMQVEMFQMLQAMDGAMSHWQSTTYIPPPDLLRSWCDSLPRQVELMNKLQHMPEHLIEPDVPQRISTSSSMESDLQVSSAHVKKRLRANSAAKTFQYHTYFLNIAINLSLSISTGAGGISIAPALKIQVDRDYYSWEGYSKFSLFSDPALAGSDLKAGPLIHYFQKAFSVGTADPSGTISFPLNKQVPLVNLLGLWYFFRREQIPNIYKIVKFFVDCGSIPRNDIHFGVLQMLCNSVVWGEEEYAFVSFLIDIGGPLGTDHMYTMTEVVKKNLRRMISRNADGISAPEIIKALLRKSEKDLKKELQKFQSQPYSEEEGNRLLTFAFGWPKGIRILLESGIDARSFQLRPVCAGLFETESLDSDDYYDSIKILLDAQCRLDLDDIVFFRSKIIRSLLIQEVVKRRKELWRLAQAYLPVNVIDKFRKEGDELIDTDLPTICEALAEVRGDTDHGISENYWRFQGGSVYHSYAITGSSIIQLEALDEMYAAGFRDFDVPDQRGMTPLMLCSFDDYLFRSAIWFISKGANYLRKFPYSNATIAHSWSASLTYNVWLDAGRWTLEQPQRSRLERWKTGLKEHGKSIFLLPSVRDSCMCPCCPGGCTTLSVIFRCTEDLVRQVNSGAVNSAKIFSLWMTDEPAPDLGKRLNSTAFQELLRIVMEFCKERPGSEQTIMRSLTFEALRLKHVCCVEINQRFPWAGTGAGAMGKSEGEIEEIMAEEKEQYEMFEQLMVELTAKFDELGLPIAQFLADYWHKRMIEFLSERDPYNEEHHKEARRAGIILEEAPIEIPELVYIVANTVEEIE